MSAYVVDKAQIDALITAALESDNNGGRFYWYTGDVRHELTFDNADEVGRMLWDENVKSVTYRYPDTETDPTNLPGPVGVVFQVRGYRFDRTSFPTGRVVGSISGYEYQSCEHPGWKASAAKAFCDTLLPALIRKLPGVQGWTIDDSEAAALPKTVLLSDLARKRA